MKIAGNICFLCDNIATVMKLRCDYASRKYEEETNMKKKVLGLLSVMALAGALAVGCGSSDAGTTEAASTAVTEAASTEAVTTEATTTEAAATEAAATEAATTEAAQ